VQKQSTFFEKHFVAKDVPLSVASPGDPCKVCASAAKQVTELVAWFAHLVAWMVKIKHVKML